MLLVSKLNCFYSKEGRVKLYWSGLLICNLTPLPLSVQ